MYALSQTKKTARRRTTLAIRNTVVAVSGWMSCGVGGPRSRDGNGGGGSACCSGWGRTGLISKTVESPEVEGEARE